MGQMSKENARFANTAGERMGRRLVSRESSSYPDLTSASISVASDVNCGVDFSVKKWSWQYAIWGLRGHVKETMM